MSPSVDVSVASVSCRRVLAGVVAMPSAPAVSSFAETPDPEQLAHVTESCELALTAAVLPPWTMLTLDPAPPPPPELPPAEIAEIVTPIVPDVYAVAMTCTAVQPAMLAV